MQDEEKTVTRMLYVFVVIALIGSFSALVSSLITMQGVFNAFSSSGLIGIITCLSALGLLRIRQFSIPRFVLPSIVYIFATYLIFTGVTMGVRDEAILLYSLVVALAGLLLGRKGVVVFGVLSVIATGGSVFAEMNGFIANHITENTTNYNTLVNIIVIYGLTFGMMYILVDILTANLEKARSSQLALRQTNQELLFVRESLEQRVTDRTHAAETARKEAEAARFEAETQTWFARGQAQLAERMRGELDMPTLANNITSYLSQYLGAQTGVLFVASGDFLKLMGRYAYVEHAGQKSEFRIGENLIGEAAKAKQMIFMDEIPADAPLVSSALGEVLPRQILIAPLESNGQVLGVLEFATLTQFTPEHAFLLKRVSESVAIALRTVQTRVEMSELLEQSQRQAEELQAQEEELRMINEELQSQAENLGTFTRPRK